MSAIKVFGSAQVKQFDLTKFDYTQDASKMLAEFSAKVSSSKKELATAFNTLCHICYAQACAYKTQKERHEKIVASKDSFEKVLPKEYVRAYARAIQALEWQIDESFDSFDFSAFLEKSAKEEKVKEYGKAVLIKRWEKALESLENKKVLTEGQFEEKAVYAFILEAVRNMPE